jgi:molybdate transport system substrate-binding protein
LRDPVEDAARQFEDAHTGLAVQVNFGSSIALRTQIEQGARVDVFLSADEANAEDLVASGLASGPPTAFARTSLSIVVPADDPAGIGSPLDLARPGVKLVAAGEGVPVTIYAGRVLEALSTKPGYPADFVDAVLANVVTREPDARAVLTKVELGEGDAAIVYTTDARRSRLVRVIGIAGDANVAVSYAGVVLAAAPRPADARAFLAWLTGPEGRAIFSKYGFEVGP